MIVAGTLPLTRAHALWSRFFPERKGWDGQLPKKLTPPVYIFVWGERGLGYEGFSGVGVWQRRITASHQVPQEYLFGNVDSQTVAEMARRMGISLVRLPMVDRAFESQKRMEVEVFRREYQRRFDDEA
jgi:hypothetical protein